MSRVCTPGVLIELAPAVIHRMHNLDGLAPALTLHLYSPPLVRQGIYRLVEGKGMLRFAVDGDEELRPLADGEK